MTCTLRSLLIALGAVGLLLGGSVEGEAQQPEVQAAQDGVQLNFQDLDLSYVLAALAQAASLNVIYHDLPEKAVTLRTTQPVPVEAIPELLRSLAEANGVSVTQEAGFLRLQGAGEAEEADLRELYIYRLEHARSEFLAATLQALFGGALPGGGATGRPATLSQQLDQAAQQSFGGLTGGGFGGQQSFVIQPGGGGALEGDVLIVPEPVTNSLLVRATPADWLIMQQALQALDLRPLQVVIEVVIAEVRRSDELDLGTAFEISSSDQGGDGSTTGTLEGDPDPPVRGDFSLDLLRTGDLNVEATLSAMAATGDVRILSRPVVLAQNNQEARILVGTERPFVQVSRTLPTDEGARDQVVQYRDVGTVLTILPTINDEGYVNLAVVQEVSSATTETQFGAPIISTREASTQILARTGQTVVLGGLVDRQENEVTAGIPLLKDIPILGHLFGYTRTVSGNSELFLFLTPYVVTSDADADAVREQIESDSGMVGPILPSQTLTPPVPAPSDGDADPTTEPLQPAVPDPDTLPNGGAAPPGPDNP